MEECGGNDKYALCQIIHQRTYYELLTHHFCLHGGKSGIKKKGGDVITSSQVSLKALAINKYRLRVMSIWVFDDCCRRFLCSAAPNRNTRRRAFINYTDMYSMCESC